MPRVALAVLETHAENIRNVMTRNDPEQTFGSVPYTCGRCGASFVIFFVDNRDPGNDSYAATLQERIVAGCEEGRHPFDGYPLIAP
jgi:hypothetical protein